MKRSILSSIVVVLIGSAAMADTFNIELDWMQNLDHSHKPTTAMLNAVKQAFACQGHTLNIDLDESVGHRNVLVRNPNDCNTSLFGYDNGTISSFGQIRQSFFDHEGQAGWYYGVFAHQYENTSCNTTGSSGLSNGGTFFIVTLGNSSSAFSYAATLMHEFGHNLGLSHCGTQYCGGTTSRSDYVGPQVPNMPSTMSYDYQLRGVKSNMLCRNISIPNSLYKEIDYSHGHMCTQNENALDERFGSGMTELDWDCDGNIENSVTQNINTSSNGWCNAGGNRTTVSDYNEWGNLSPGAFLEEATKSGDADDLRRADYRFIDPNDREAVKRQTLEFLERNKRPDLRVMQLEAQATGDPAWLEQARFVTFDPSDREAVKRVAAAELERRRVMFDDQPCISSDESDQNIAGACAQQATLTTESCLAGTNAYVGTLFCIPVPAICFDFGTCGFPHGTITNAQAIQPARSTFYIKPGTYNEPNSTVLNKRGIWTCERTDGSSAVIR